MKKYKYLFFDLDGTLTDSCEGIYKSFEYALNFYGIEIENFDVLRPILGPPLKDSFMDLFGFDEEKAVEAVRKYRERFSDVGIYENRVYDGVENMLAGLKNEGYILALATSKPLKFAKTVLEMFKLDGYFDLIDGAELEGRISTKEDVLADIIERLHISDNSEILMIGDRKYDLLGAASFGIDAMGVLYGYGSEEELSLCPHVYLASDTDDVLGYLI